MKNLVSKFRISFFKNDIQNLKNMKGDFSHIHHVNTNFLTYFFSEYKPVFILNTGRSGSAFLNEILANYSNLSSFHEAKPNLMMFPNYAFHNQDKDEVLREVFRAGRMELMLEAFLERKIYVETNQCLVFFCNQIIELFPGAKFVHLIRHPGDFVRSAVMKGWHKNDSLWENGRIRINDENEWKKQTHIEKLGWVWKNTHEFIEEVKKTRIENFKTFKLEDLVKNDKDLKDLLDFIGVQDVEKNLNEKMNFKVNQVFISENEPSNMFKKENFPRYSEWGELEKKQLRKLVMPLALKYRYNV